MSAPGPNHIYEKYSFCAAERSKTPADCGSRSSEACADFPFTLPTVEYDSFPVKGILAVNECGGIENGWNMRSSGGKVWCGLGLVCKKLVRRVNMCARENGCLSRFALHPLGIMLCPEPTLRNTASRYTVFSQRAQIKLGLMSGCTYVMLNEVHGSLKPTGESTYPFGRPFTVALQSKSKTSARKSIFQ